MNVKRIIGIILIVVGLFLIVFSAYVKTRIGEAKKIVHETTSPFSTNPVGKMLGSAVEEKAKSYDTLVFISLIGGIVFAIAGGGMVFFFKKK